MERKKLTAEEILQNLAELNFWKAIDGKLLKRYKFANFAESLAFINKIGEIAEAKDHHPDISFGWGFAEIYITTHSEGGLTALDFALAKEIDGIT